MIHNHDDRDLATGYATACVLGYKGSLDEFKIEFLKHYKDAENILEPDTPKIETQNLGPF